MTARARRVLGTLALGLAFAIAYAQSPLYTENQNAHFVRGLARAGLGSLSRDWAANSTDPFPVFSWLLTGLVRIAPVWTIHGVYAVLLALYGIAMCGVVAATLTLSRPQWRLVWIGATGLHAAIVISAAGAVGWRAIPEYLQWGYKHSILGGDFQPSAAGGLLIVSIWAFLCGRPWLAVVISGVVAAIHPGYVISIAGLTLGYMTSLVAIERAWGRALLVGGLSFLAVLPTVVHVSSTFGPTTPDAVHQASAILYAFLYPESHVAGWFGWPAVAQTGVMLLALAVTRRRALFFVIAVPLALMAILTVVQAVTDSAWLGMMFPWRISAWLVPLSSCVLIGWAVRWCSDQPAARLWLTNRRTVVAASVAMTLLAVGGVGISWHRVRYADAMPERDALEFVRTHREPGDLYLIPLTMQSFRLYTGAPVVVENKVHPYKDVEILQWWTRYTDVDALYRSTPDDVCRRLTAVAAKYGATHVVTPADLQMSCPGTRELFAGRVARVFRVSHQDPVR
jgi:hypothetical protein